MCVCVGGGACLCVYLSCKQHASLLFTAEITSPAALGSVLHHEDSWSNDFTSEPQTGPDQVLELRIKYLSALSNYHTAGFVRKRELQLKVLVLDL